MGILWDIPNWIKNSGFLLASILISLYFSFSLVNGERGLLKYIYLRQEIDTAQKIAKQYNAQKVALEEKVKHLSNTSLDLDLLEERARIVLNLAGKDEFILLDEKDD